MQAEESVSDTKPTLTDLFRVWFKDFLDPIAAFLNRLGLAPNTLTLLGLAGNFVAAAFLARGEFLIGGVIVIVMGPIDALDGAMARLRGEPSEFGAFVDSVTDRYSELVIYAGLLAHYAVQADRIMVLLVFLAAAGSVLVSYVRARAEGLGYSAKIGLLTRLERYMVLAPSLVLGYPRIGIALVALLANVTALQRILYVRRQARGGGKETSK